MFCRLDWYKPLVFAEWVETEEQRQLLINMGCKDYQGYQFGKQAPIGQFEALLTQSNINDAVNLTANLAQSGPFFPSLSTTCDVNRFITFPKCALCAQANRAGIEMR